MRAIGIDLSLTSTGVATSANAARIQTKNLRGLLRIRWLLDQIATWMTAQQVHRSDLVVVEGPSFASTGRQDERSGLRWMLYDRVEKADLRLAVVSPNSLKMYATGKGNAGKDEVLLAMSKRFDFVDGNDVADATCLMCMGQRWLGAPVDTVPQKNVKALDKCEWPIGSANA